jgi:DNA modification methylase
MPLPTLKPYWQTTDRRTLRFYHGDALAVASKLPTGSVHCMVTSPPYWGLRDYGTGSWEGGDSSCDHVAKVGPARSESSTLKNDGRLNFGSRDYENNRVNYFHSKCKKCGARRVDQQLGSEPTVQEYVDKLVAIFRELRRVLRDNGTLWLNLGDTYGGGGNIIGEGVYSGEARRLNMREQYSKMKGATTGLPAGNLVGVPWRVAFALQEDGWVLRQDIIWGKMSPMPESVTNRCTKAHEYIFLLTKGRDYFYDAEAIKERAFQPGGEAKTAGRQSKQEELGRSVHSGTLGTNYGPDCRNKRSVWTVSHGGGYQGAHFATYPPALIEPCILAGTSEHGCCPRCGASWERVVGRARMPTRPGVDSKVNKWNEDNASSAALSNKALGNRDPQRHVSDTRSLGWRPGCKCYGLELIGDPPPEPNKGPKENEPDFQARYASWRTKQTEWESRWKALKPAYDRAWDPDDDGEGEGAVPCVVLDPFIGSGTTALVCLDKGRVCWGIDLSKEYLDQHAVERCRGNLLTRPLLAKLAGPRPQGVPTP